MRRDGRLLALAAITVAAIAAPPLAARAQPSASDKVVAEALFQDGRKLLGQGRTSEACPKFGESEKLVPKLGTLLNLATCHEDTGKTASAWAEFTEAEAQALKSGQEERAKYARQHVDALARKLSRLVIQVPDAAPGTRVELDGSPIGAAAWGTPVPVDPGDHTLLAAAPGKRSWKGAAHADPGPSTARVVVPALAAESSPPAVTTQAAASPATPETSTDTGGTRRALGWAAVGVGAVGLGIGTYFGVRTFSKMDDSNASCSGTLCNADGVELRKDASRSATISTIAFAAGAVVAAAGVVLLVAGGAKDHPSASARLRAR